MLRATFRSLLARKLRLLLSATAVVLGVAFVAGSLTLTSTLNRVFVDLFADVNAKSDVLVRGPVVLDTGDGPATRGPVPASLLPQVARVPGVAHATGDVQGYAQVVRRDGTAYDTGGAPAFGIDYDTDPRTSTFTVGTGRPPSGADEVAVDLVTAREAGLHPGDAVRVELASGARSFHVVGTFSFGRSGSTGGASIVAFEPATARELLARPGELQAVRVAAEPGLSQAELRDRIAHAIPADYSAVTGKQQADEDAGTVQQALGFFTTFLLVFAVVALFVGAFLIFNTFTMLVAQRQRELALLRALGASRRQVTRSVLLESLVVGVVASGLGLGAGVGVAVGLRALVGAFGIDLPDGPLVVTGTTVAVSLGVGIVVTTAAALLPARRASAVPPVAAMREALAPEGSLRRTGVAGTVLLAVGATAVAYGLQGRLVLLGIGALICFLGVAALSPLLSRPVARVIGAPLARRLPGRLGRRNAMRNPRRTATTAAALMIGLALVSAVSVVGSSAKASIDVIVRGALGADLVVQPRGGAEGLTPDVATALAAAPEVGRVDRLHFGPARVGSSARSVTTVPRAALGSTVLVTRATGDVGALGPDTLLMSSRVAEDLHLNVGDAVPVRLERGSPLSLRLAGTYVENQLAGDVLLDDSAAAGFAGRLDGVDLVEGREGVPAAALRSAVDRIAATSPTAEVLDRQQFTGQAADQIDTLTGIINVLLLLSVLIAVLGIVNTLALAVLERTRELGMLRAVGLARRQTRRMVRVEAVIVAVFGALLGIGVGTAFGVAFQHALAGQGVTELRVPVVRLAVFVVVAGLAGVLAAVLPARRAARLDVLQAIATA